MASGQTVVAHCALPAKSTRTESSIAPNASRLAAGGGYE